LSAGPGKKRRSDRTGYYMILPALIVVGLFTIFPFAEAIYLSLVNYITYKPGQIGSFAGLNNYAGVARESFFVQSVVNTFLFTAVSTAIIVVIGLGIATVLNQRFRGASIVTSVMLVSWAVPPAAAGLMWRFMFQSSGWVNRILIGLGLLKEPIYFLGAPQVVQILYAVVVQVWQQLPFAVLLLLATMQLVPRGIMDSAEIDGARSLSKFRDIVFPFLKPAILVVAAFEAFLALTTYDLVYSFAGGEFGLISYYTFAEMFTYSNFGYGAALAVILALMSMVVILVILRIVPPNKLYRYSFTGE
jgi:ABC-type sugar transport system permease subunit